MDSALKFTSRFFSHSSLVRLNTNFQSALNTSISVLMSNFEKYLLSKYNLKSLLSENTLDAVSRSFIRSPTIFFDNTGDFVNTPSSALRIKARVVSRFGR